MFATDAVQVNTAKLAALPQFAELSPKEKASLLEGSTVSGDRLSMIKKAIKLSSREYMKYADYSIDPDALAQQVAVAALALHEEVRAQR